MPQQIGSVEIKRVRVYPADPHDPSSPDVMVQPGIFPLMRSGDRIWWPMRGRVSKRQPGGFKRIGEGMFTGHSAYDEVTEDEWSITSREFAPSEFAELMAEAGFRDEDGPEQRVAIRLFKPLTPHPTTAGSSREHTRHHEENEHD